MRTLPVFGAASDAEALAAKLYGNCIQNKATGCWEWRGARTKSGYGQIQVTGVGVRLAHRLSHAIASGRDPVGRLVLHSCDNPPCVNPQHLRDGTHSENMRDAISRGRKTRVPQTHCHAGHEFTAENTRLDGRGARVCRECKRLTNRRLYPGRRDKCLEYKKLYRERNAEKIREDKKAWRIRERAARMEYQREYRARRRGGNG